MRYAGPSSVPGDASFGLYRFDDFNRESGTNRVDIERLVTEEYRLLAQQTLADSDRFRIQEIRVAFDRCCDELRQRRVVWDRQQSLGQPRV